jgi:hypothetical protein
MGAEENVALMRRWFDEVWNHGRTAIVNELLDDKISATGQGEPDSPVMNPRRLP